MFAVKEQMMTNNQGHKQLAIVAIMQKTRGRGSNNGNHKELKGAERSAASPVDVIVLRRT